MRLHVYVCAGLECQCVCMYLVIMAKPSENTVQAWARLLRVHQAALSSVELMLKTDGLPPLVWYDVLLELDRAGEKGLRPFELERGLLLPQYGVSRLIERIEKAGHVKSVASKDDGRGQNIVITATGKGLRRRMWRVYGQGIEAAVGAKLNSGETKKFSELLYKLME